MPAAPRSPTGPSRVQRDFHDDDDDDERSGLGARAYIAIVVVVVIVIVVGVVLFKHHSAGSTPPAVGATATSGTATTPATQPTATASAPTGASGAPGATTAYKLSTPSKAGGYPLGQDPNFLTTTKSTAERVVAAMSSAGGGTVTGSPVSGAYQLPDTQAITFVGYQGSFTPAKVASILSSIGSDGHTYPAGSHGGTLGCVNTPATATETSGAVCIWATSSTLGVTEFFTATGPESLTQSQNKGASDTVNLRTDVETKS
jgi:hypothetical protein